MTPKTSFFSELSEKIRTHLSSCIHESKRDIFAFGKRGPSITLGNPGSEARYSELKLQFMGYEVINDVSGTFQVENSSDELYVYKLPSRIKASYCLDFAGVDIRESLKVFDELSSRLFNQRTLEPYIPEAFKDIPPLFTRMNVPADFVMTKAGISQSGQGYEMNFEYKGLYHSGEALRLEKRVKQRDIQTISKIEGVL